MTVKDGYLIAELEEKLRWYRDEASEEEFDAEEVDAICTLLQKISPVEEPHMGREEAFLNIMRRVEEEDKGGGDGADERNRTAGKNAVNEKSEEGEKGGRRERKVLFEKRGFRAAILFIAVFGGVLLSLNMVTYAREDKSLFTMIMERVGLLEIVKDEEAVSEMIDFGAETRVFCDSWMDLDGEIKSKIMVPEYIPKEYELYGIDSYCLNDRKKINANYYNGDNGHLMILITLWEKNPDPYREMAIDEDTYVLLSEYSNKNTLYYQYEDEYICMISMDKGFYRISGNIALEEMIKVRNGLGNIK